MSKDMDGLASPDRGVGGSANSAVRDVLAERRRQVEVEGWHADHDDDHDTGSLAAAAGTYALVASGKYRDVAKQFWPWDFQWWKPADPRRNLVKAGALILAEIERLDRVDPPTDGAEPAPAKVRHLNQSNPERRGTQ